MKAILIRAAPPTTAEGTMRGLTPCLSNILPNNGEKPDETIPPMVSPITICVRLHPRSLDMGLRSTPNEYSDAQLLANVANKATMATYQPGNIR